MTDNKGMSNVWQQDGVSFWPSNTAKNVKELPPAIYRYQQTMTGWYLQKIASYYEFPYKIYGTNDAIIERVKAAWKKLPANVGVLLNGLKGTGKTITAQQIVNWAISEGLVVLSVNEPVPLETIIERVEQPMLVLFDEFEKTHDEEQNPGAQQKILTVVDGLSRSTHRRIFLFTTNTKNVNENFIDRPSRIRYHWEFGRLNIDVIEAVLDDMLDVSLKNIRHEIIDYLNTREVLTIDVVKAVVTECNIFKQSPAAFGDFMNLTEKEDTAFSVDVVNENGLTTEISSYYKMRRSSDLTKHLSKSGQKNFVNLYTANGNKHTIQSINGQIIELIGPTDVDNEWICHVQMPVYKTWVTGKLMHETNDYLWLDVRPEGWTEPAWAKKFIANQELTAEEYDDKYEWQNYNSVYGTENRKKVRVRFNINKQPYVYDFRNEL